MSNIQITEPLVSVDWLYQHLDNDRLIVLDATIKKVTDVDSEIRTENYIPKTRFFDIKNEFSDVNAPFPNTIPSQEQFTKAAQDLGINQNSIIVVYDNKGIYSSPRVWWLFKTMGFHNVAVLDGGLLKWILRGYETAYLSEYSGDKGNFEARYNAKFMRFFDDVKTIVSNNSEKLIDARSAPRFKGEVMEPRKGLHSGHIPNSLNIPYASLMNGNVLKSKQELHAIFKESINKEDSIVFTCGSGITACILALAAELCGYQNLSIYDGSWTEWGSLMEN